MQLLLAALLQSARPAQLPLLGPSIPQACARQPVLNRPVWDGLML